MLPRCCPLANSSKRLAPAAGTAHALGRRGQEAVQEKAKSASRARQTSDRSRLHHGHQRAPRRPFVPRRQARLRQAPWRDRRRGSRRPQDHLSARTSAGGAPLRDVPPQDQGDDDVSSPRSARASLEVRTATAGRDHDGGRLHTRVCPLRSTVLPSRLERRGDDGARCGSS